MLSAIAILTGIAAAVLFFVAASRQPEKAGALRFQGALFAGLAVVVAVVMAL